METLLPPSDPPLLQAQELHPVPKPPPTTGRKPRRSNYEVCQAIKKHNGNLSQAAIELGYKHYPSFNKRVRSKGLLREVLEKARQATDISVVCKLMNIIEHAPVAESLKAIMFWLQSTGAEHLGFGKIQADISGAVSPVEAKQNFITMIQNIHPALPERPLTEVVSPPISDT